MKLGYVCQYFTREYRGPVTNLMYELSKTIRVINYSSERKHSQYYSDGKHPRTCEDANENLTLKRYQSYARLSGLIYPKDLTRLLASDSPDIVQTEEYYQPATHTSFRYCKKNKLPLVINHRGSDPRDRTMQERMFFRLVNPYSKKAVDYAGAIVCLSKRGKDLFTQTYPDTAEKTHVIPNSIDPKVYAGGDGQGFRKSFKIPESSPLIVCVARIHEQKRIDLLIEMFSKVKEEVKDSVLAIVGPSFEKEQAKADRLIQKLKLDDVLFTGPIPNTQIKDAYSAADTVALTSEWEPFGYSLLEAMSCSKPVLAFKIGAIPEIIDDGKTGYLADFSDTTALAQKATDLLNDPGLARGMGDAARDSIDVRFNIRENAAKLISLYGGLIEDG